MITHKFLLFVSYVPNYTGLLHRAFWKEFFCVLGRLHKVLSVNAPTTHINCLGINCPITRTSVTRKNCFRIICVIISGPIVNNSFKGLSRDYPGTVPGLSRHFLEMSWEFCLCVSLFPQEKATHKQIWSPPVLGTIPKSCLCVLVFFSTQRESFRAGFPADVIRADVRG